MEGEGKVAPKARETAQRHEMEGFVNVVSDLLKTEKRKKSENGTKDERPKMSDVSSPAPPSSSKSDQVRGPRAAKVEAADADAVARARELASAATAAADAVAGGNPRGVEEGGDQAAPEPEPEVIEIDTSGPPPLWQPLTFAQGAKTTFVLKAIEETVLVESTDAKKIALFDELRLMLRDLSLEEYEPDPEPPPPPEPVKEDPAQAKAAAKMQAALRGASTRRALAIEANEETLRTSFIVFANYGKARGQSTEMQGRNFVKQMKDCGVLGKQVNANDCDLIFAKVKTKGKKTITYEQWLDALKQVGEKTKIGVDGVKKLVVTGGGRPKNHGGTVAEPNRFHDDKSLYGQGVVAHGGPHTVDGDKSSLAGHVDRTKKADVRGVVSG